MFNTVSNHWGIDEAVAFSSIAASRDNPYLIRLSFCLLIFSLPFPVFYLLFSHSLSWFSVGILFCLVFEGGGGEKLG